MLKFYKDQYANLQNEIRWLKLIALGVIALLLIVLVFIFKGLKSRETIIDIILESERINKRFSQKNTHQPTSNTYTITGKDIDLIAKRVSEHLQTKENTTKQLLQTPQTLEKDTPPILQKTNYKYLKGKTGKTFNRAETTPEDSFFRLLNESGDMADFEFFGNEEEAIARRIFHEDICQILSGSYLSAHSVKMITAGKIKRNGEQWIVLEPIKIILT